MEPGIKRLTFAAIDVGMAAHVFRSIVQGGTTKDRNKRRHFGTARRGPDMTVWKGEVCVRSAKNEETPIAYIEAKLIKPGTSAALYLEDQDILLQDDPRSNWLSLRRVRRSGERQTVLVGSKLEPNGIPKAADQIVGAFLNGEMAREISPKPSIGRRRKSRTLRFFRVSPERGVH